MEYKFSFKRYLSILGVMAVIAFLTISDSVHLILHNFSAFLNRLLIMELIPGTILAIVVIFDLFRIRRANKLLLHGIPLIAKIKEIKTIKGKYGPYYHIEATTEESGKIYKSHTFYGKQPNAKEGDEITILVDQKNPRRYIVDTRAIQLRSDIKKPTLN